MDEIKPVDRLVRDLMDKTKAGMSWDYTESNDSYSTNIGPVYYELRRDSEGDWELLLDYDWENTGDDGIIIQIDDADIDGLVKQVWTSYNEEWLEHVDKTIEKVLAVQLSTKPADLDVSSL